MITRSIQIYLIENQKPFKLNLALKKIPVFLLLLFSCFFSVEKIHGQGFYRIKADFSIKEKTPDGKSQLIMGKVYYDKTSKKIIYDINFPEKEMIIVTDSFMIRIIDKKVIEKKRTSNTNEFSIFHLCLNGNLTNFGLKNSPYTIEKVEKEKDMVITTWMPPANFRHLLGKTLLSQKEKKLFGLVLFTPKDMVMGKQFFKNYLNVNGLEFPGEVIQITYVDEKEFYKITTFKNIVVNDIREDNIYNFSIPD